MQTPIIQHPSNVAKEFSSPAKANAGASSDMQFNQMLSRELSDRQQMKPNNDKSNTIAPPKASNSSNQVNKADNQVKDNHTSIKPSSADNLAKKTNSSSSETKVRDDTDADSEGKEDDAADAPNDLLALVAGINQLMVNAAATSNTDDSVAVADGSTIALSDKLASTKNAMSAVADTALTNTAEATDPLLKAATDANTDLLSAQNGAAEAKEPAFKTSLQKAASDITIATSKDAANPTSAASTSKVDILSDANKIVADKFNALPLKSNELAHDLMAPSIAPVPQASLSIGQAMHIVPTERLAPHVGTPAWDQALGQKVIWMVGGAQQSASLSLNPPDLGPMQIILSVSNDQATATFVTAQPEVRQALEAAIPKLREMLGEAGIQLGATNVSTQTSNQQNTPEQQARQASSTFDVRQNAIDANGRILPSQAIKSGNGLVDTFA